MVLAMWKCVAHSVGPAENGNTLISGNKSCQPVFCTAAGRRLIGHHWEIASVARQFVPPPLAPRKVLANVFVHTLGLMVGKGVKLTIELNRSQSC